MAFNNNTNTTGTGLGSTHDNDARLGSGEKIKRSVVPDAVKSDGQIRREEAEGRADNAISHAPGQGKVGDNFNSNAGNPGIGNNAHTLGGNSNTGGLPGTGSGPNYHGSGSTALDSHKPTGQQTYGDQARVGADQARSHIQPNDSKPAGTEAHDFVTSGNDSKTGSGLHNAKEKVANVFRKEGDKNPNV